MRLTHNDVNFDVTYEGHQNCLKNIFMDLLKVFDDHVQIDHSYHFLPPNQSNRLKLVCQKYFTISQFTRKLLITKILERCQEVLYKSSIDTAPLSLTFHAINRQFIHWFENWKLQLCGMNQFDHFFYNLRSPK